MSPSSSCRLRLLHVTVLLALVATTQTSPGKVYVMENPKSWEGPVNKQVVLQCEFNIPPEFMQQTANSDIKWSWRPAGDFVFRDVQQSRTLNNRVTELESTYSVDDRTKRSRLEFERVHGANAGEYKCIFAGGQTYGGAETDLATIKIVPEVMIYPSVVDMELGKPFQITCNLTIALKYYTTPGSAGQTRADFKWRVSTTTGVDPDASDQMEFLYEQRYRDPLTIPGIAISNGGRMLAVANATLMHAGYYWCTFDSNSKAFTGHVKQRAIVKYGPRFKEDENGQQNTTRTVKAFLGETVDIYCNILSLPHARVQWFHGTNDIPIRTGTLRHPQSQYHSDRWFRMLPDEYSNPTVLRLNRLVYDDRDEYTCNVTSGGVKLSWSTLLKVKDKYSSFYPLAVIVAQITLIFSLIFAAEKIYVKRDHDHDHHAQPVPNQNSRPFNFIPDDHTSNVKRNHSTLNAQNRGANLSPGYPHSVQRSPLRQTRML